MKFDVSNQAQAGGLHPGLAEMSDKPSAFFRLIVMRLLQLDEGYDQTSICEALGIGKGYVSRVKKNAIQDGLLTKKNELTQSGFKAVCKVEI